MQGSISFGKVSDRDRHLEKTVTLRFYEVDRDNNRPPLSSVLQAIAEHPVADRGRHITGEQVFVRLENFVLNGDYLEGQFVRGQSANRPGVMGDAGTVDLPFEQPIGHGIAFRYHIPNGLLAIEYNPLVLSPSRVMAYLYECDPHAEFRLAPRMRQDAWARFNAMPLRKMIVTIAGHPDVAEDDNPVNATWSNLADMSERYEAHSIKVEIGMGHHHGSLGAAAKNFVREAYQRFEDGVDDIRSIKGVLETGDGQPNDEVNLIGDLLDIKEELTFPENNWAQFYILRRNLLENVMNAAP